MRCAAPLATEIFEKLQSAKEYRSGCMADKLRIIERLSAIRPQLCAFAAAPHRLDSDINGFLVESCARFSRHVPQNGPLAQGFAELIIRYLKDRKLCNPDYIWLDLQGTHIRITGIGEVKSHIASIIHRPNQIFFQQKNMRDMIHSGAIKTLLPASYRVDLAEQFLYRLILPRSSDAPYILPACVPLEWKITELEFTFFEILLLKQIFLSDPDIREKIDIVSPVCPREPYEILASKICARIEHILAQMTPLACNAPHYDMIMALCIWTLLWNSIPTSARAMQDVLSWGHQLPNVHGSVLSLLLSPPVSLMILARQHSDYLSAIMKYAESNNVLLVHAFLSRIHELREHLPPPPQLRETRDIDILAML